MIMVLMSMDIENKGASCCLTAWRAGTLKSHVHFICSSHTTTMFADLTSSGNTHAYMLAPSKTAENNW